MFNKDFYPTPKSLVKKMISKVGIIKFYGSSILEPSAGKGDILDVLLEEIKCSRDNLNIDCIEKEPELRSILKGKKYRVIYDDFLSFYSQKKYNLIIMNPPFSEGDKHLLKAISIIKKYGGQIVCLLNAETIKNPYTVYRKDLLNQLEENNAEIQFLQDEFKNAERSTNVEIALIYLNIPEKIGESDLLKNLKKAEKEKEYFFENKQVTHNDFLKNIIEHYNFEINAGIAFLKEYERIKPFFKSSFDVKYEHYVISVKVDEDSYGYDTINRFICFIRKKYWKQLISSDKFRQLFTSNILDELLNKIEELKDYDFNEYNIMEIQKELNINLVKSVEETILSLFDELSYKHYYREDYGKNIHYYNGWKTNKAYKINKKVIIPLNAWDSWFNRMDTYGVVGKLLDMEKVLNYLNNKEIESIDLNKTIEECFSQGITKNIECRYFTLTFYKKGTCHLVFKDDDLLLKFNIFGSQKKGWLPHEYGKKSYEEMVQEEKSIIDSFQGKEEYNKVFFDKKNYIININRNLLEMK